MTIYVDMDGVIADFFGGLEKFYGVDHWKMVKEASILGLKDTDFFNILEPFETSADLIDHVRRVSGGDWGICSSPLRDDFANSTYWKRVWLNDRCWLPDIDKLIFTSRKHKFATSPLDGKPNILIDDKPSNIKAWNEAGGIGIRYQANEDDLEEYLFMELDEALWNIQYSKY
jgi:5'(3')-deoxyribonucleotidase